MITTAKRLESVQEYYFSRKLKEVRQLMFEGKPIINMGIGSPDLAPHSSVIEAIQKAMFDEKAHEYQSYQGLPELREAMFDFYVLNFGISKNCNLEFLPLMGSKEGIMHISLAFLNEGDEVLIPNPGYPTYASVTELVQAKAVYYNLKEVNNWQPDFDTLEKTDLSKVKLMWVSYPHMPTGANATLELYQKLIDFGADVILGSQAHQAQEIALYKGKVIFYGLGNFMFDQIHRLGVRQAFFLEGYFYNGKIIQFQPVYTFMNKDRQRTWTKD